MFGRLASMIGRAAGGGSSLPTVPPSTLYGLFGPPRHQLDPTQDHILSDIFSPPYRGPGDLDNYGCETPAMRLKYRTQHREAPVLRAAINGKADDIAALEPTVLAADKDDRESNAAAEFVKWTVSMAPGGWPGLVDSIYRPASIDGFSLLEKKLKQQFWKGRNLWGLAHCRSIDTVHIRLQLDVYRNVVGVVNLLRGLEYYDPSQVILYTHNGMYGNPFGQSDVRCVTKAASIIEDVYKVWYVALKVYGLPYMKGKYSQKTTKKVMEAALRSLREGGYIAVEKDDDVEILNLAAGAAINGFESIIRTQREDTFYGVRGAALPFMEGKGSSGAHGDTEVEQGTSDAGEKRISHNVADVINRQLIPWLCAPNFQLDESRMPRAKFGGTNWKQVKEVIGIIKEGQEIGLDVSAEFAHDAVSMPAPRNEQDRLVSAQEKQQKAQQQQQTALPGLVPPAIPAAQPQPAAAPPATFSADHNANAVDPAQVARVVDALVKELVA